MILYRPVGLQELELIYDSGMKAFPARLPQQPIFYPVLQLEYARKTASGWNAKKGDSAGYVTEFKMQDEYIGQFETHMVGKSQYQELWIPAEEMEEFNKHILGHIKVVEAYFGDGFEGFVPEQFGLGGKNAVEQFTLLANSYLYKRMDFYLEIKRNHKAVFLNYPFWQTHEFKNPGLKEKILQAIKEGWLTSFPKIPLPNPVQKDNTPAEQTDEHSHAQRLVKSVREDTPPKKQTPARAPRLAKPVPEELTSEQETDSNSFDDPEEEIELEEQTTSDSLSDSVEEDIIALKQTDWYARAHELAKTLAGDSTFEGETDSDSFDDPDDEDITLEEQGDSGSFDDLVDKNIPPVSQTVSSAHVRRLAKPIQEDITPVEKINSHFAQGLELGLWGKYHEAIDELFKAVKEDPEHVVAHTSLGVAFHRLGEEDRALACYETALRIDPIYAEAHYFRANILYSHGNVREAIAGYTIAIGLKPELIEAHQQPSPEDRLTDYSPAPAEMHWIAKPAHRILDLNKSLETNPGQASLFKERAAEYYRLRNYVQAISDYSSSLEIQPDDASVLHLRGVAYEQIGQLDRALEDYQRAIAINPQYSDEYINRGVTFGQMGHFRQSIASFTEAIRLAPKNPNGYFNRGTAYLQQGDLERAIEDFSSVIRLSPRDEAAYYWRGISHEAAGHQREAIADYRQFLALSQDESARREIEQKLRAWNEGDRNGVSHRSVVPNDRQETHQVQSEKPDQELDLYDLIIALGERALNSIWFGSGVDCYGEKAEELYAFTDHNRPIEGRDFLNVTSGIRQTIAGDFHAFDPSATSHWIFIRAWDGSGFYIEIDDSNSKERLKTHFQSVEEVDGAPPPYKGLFIRI